MLYVFSTCRDGFIRTIPALTLDAADPEDIDTTTEDHVYDEVRYACMSRPQAPNHSNNQPQDRWQHAFKEKETEGWKTT